jgi:N6-adenosine-specific RNA methylase IME4
MTVDDVCAMAAWEPGSPLTERKHESRPNGKVPAKYLVMCGERHPIADDALLFLWRVSSQVEEAYRVVRAWGFVPKSEIVWVKTTGTRVGYELGGSMLMPEPGEEVIEQKLHFGMGRYTRASHETCIIAARGKAIPLIQNRSTRSVFYAPTGAHSQKPEAFYKLIEGLCVGPRLELFARAHREGWMCVGDELSEEPVASAAP